MNCKHGLLWETCSFCQRERLTKSFVPRLIYHQTEKLIGLTAGDPDPDGLVRVLALRIAGQQVSLELARVNPVGMEPFVEDGPDREKLPALRGTFRKYAMDVAHINEPDRPRTQRECTGFGPSRCWCCRQPLSFANSSLACRACTYYVCSCGHCMCDFPGGRNYLDQFVPAGRGLPCDLELRSVCVSVVRAIARDGNWAT
jgi:hypothetical protein